MRVTLTEKQAKRLKKGDKLTVFQYGGGIPDFNIPGGWQTGYFKKLAKNMGSPVIVCQLPIPPHYPELNFYYHEVKSPGIEDAFEDWGMSCENSIRN